MLKNDMFYYKNVIFKRLKPLSKLNVPPYTNPIIIEF